LKLKALLKEAYILADIVEGSNCKVVVVRNLLIDVMVALVEVAEANNSRTLPSFHFSRQQNIVKGSSQPSKMHNFLPQGQASIDSSWLRLIDAVSTVVKVAEASNSRTLPSFHFPRQHNIVKGSS
ncbi:hypothetical protein Tco_1099440, partial [Tanacetum coccineum]